MTAWDFKMAILEPCTVGSSSYLPPKLQVSVIKSYSHWAKLVCSVKNQMPRERERVSEKQLGSTATSAYNNTTAGRRPSEVPRPQRSQSSFSFSCHFTMLPTCQIAWNSPCSAEECRCTRVYLYARLVARTGSHLHKFTATYCD